MKVAEYRDISSRGGRMADSYHSIHEDANASAVEYWLKSAEQAYIKVCSAGCKRTTTHDQSINEAVKEKLEQVIKMAKSRILTQQPPVMPTSNKPLASRASAYNRSASRAARMSRAARSARRKGYF